MTIIDLYAMVRFYQKKEVLFLYVRLNFKNGFSFVCGMVVDYWWVPPMVSPI
jgi:hypothetical protein